MNIKTIFVTNLPNHKGVHNLKSSLDKYKIDYECIHVVWKGFYTKVNEAYKYCLDHQELDYILFVDAHDVVFTGSMDEIESKLVKLNFPEALFSCEKAIWPISDVWPNPELAKEYPESQSPWKHLNSGTYLIKPSLLVDLVDNNYTDMLKEGMDDQLYWAHVYLTNKDRMRLDDNCDIFQTLAHDDGSSFDIKDGKFTNKLTGSNPIVIHGNATSWQLDCYKEYWG